MEVSIMDMRSNLLFDLMESEADVNIFFDRPQDNFKAEGSALILTSSPVGHFPKRRGDHYTLWFGRGIERWTYKTFKEAVNKIAEILQKVSDGEVKITFRFEGKNIKRFNRELAKIQCKDVCRGNTHE